MEVVACIDKNFALTKNFVAFLWVWVKFVMKVLKELRNKWYHWLACHSGLHAGLTVGSFMLMCNLESGFVGRQPLTGDITCRLVRYNWWLISLPYLHFQERVILVSWQMIKLVQPLVLGQPALETMRSEYSCKWLIVYWKMRSCLLPQQLPWLTQSVRENIDRVDLLNGCTLWHPGGSSAAALLYSMIALYSMHCTMIALFSMGKACS